MSLIERYEEWFKRNAVWLGPLEETARMLTLFMPGRYSSAELESEAVYTALTLLSMYHDRIMGRDKAQTTDVATREHSRTARRAQNILTVLHCSSLLGEMAGRRFFPDDSTLTVLPGWKGKWAILALVEGLKALCRLYLLKANRGRVLTPPSAHQLAVQRFKHRESELIKAVKEDPSVAGPFPDLRNMYTLYGRGDNPHGYFSAFTNAAKAEPEPEERKKEDTKPAAAAVLAEVLHIIRPVIYCVGRARTSDNLSWRPFLASLLADIFSRALHGDLAALSSREKMAVRTRVTYWLLYATRSPLWDKTLLPFLEGVKSVLNRIPLVGSFLANLVDLVISMQSYYFYTSAS